ncbi:very short patch repair endonuclease [Mycobacterium sp. 852002-30065_SCH5024008]|uniref:very short patch repair endonuclease n=1 Tax=Mycobacterium sp. 852002-30065_SCH5024008 TaxID=1834088 RepID=UPI002100902A|nr:very short patch repair endonuclease [Mycobacterium sp. 852002-30065_SCH5024008]
MRSVMRANPRRDTKPERQLRSLLHAMGLRYRVDAAPLVGVRRRADLVFPRAKVVVFVDGCFWHGCPDHYRPARKSNAEFWDAKLAENTARDRDTDQKLEANGWQVIRVWEHENMPEAAERIYRQLRARVR